MRIDPFLTDEAVLAELGTRLARARLELNLTQQRLANDAGVDRLTVQHIENGRAVKTTSLVRVLRALGLIDALDRLVPEHGPNPIEQLELQGRRRRRASGARSPSTRDPGSATRPWTWGDETA